MASREPAPPPPPLWQACTVTGQPARLPSDEGASSSSCWGGPVRPLAHYNWASRTGWRERVRLYNALTGGQQQQYYPPFLTHTRVLHHLQAQQWWEQHQRGEVQLTAQELIDVQSLRMAAPVVLPALLDSQQRNCMQAIATTRAGRAAGAIPPSMSFQPGATGMLQLLLHIAPALRSVPLTQVPFTFGGTLLYMLPRPYGVVLAAVAQSNNPAVQAALAAVEAASQQPDEEQQEAERTLAASSLAASLLERLPLYEPLCQLAQEGRAYRSGRARACDHVLPFDVPVAAALLRRWFAQSLHGDGQGGAFATWLRNTPEQLQLLTDLETRARLARPELRRSHRIFTEEALAPVDAGDGRAGARGSLYDWCKQWLSANGTRRRESEARDRAAAAWAAGFPSREAEALLAPPGVVDIHGVVGDMAAALDNGADPMED